MRPTNENFPHLPSGLKAVTLVGTTFTLFKEQFSIHAAELSPPAYRLESAFSNTPPLHEHQTATSQAQRKPHQTLQVLLWLRQGKLRQLWQMNPNVPGLVESKGSMQETSTSPRKQHNLAVQGSGALPRVSRILLYSHRRGGSIAIWTSIAWTC